MSEQQDYQYTVSVSSVGVEEQLKALEARFKQTGELIEEMLHIIARLYIDSSVSANSGIGERIGRLLEQWHMIYGEME